MIYMKEIIGKYREFAKRINPDIKVIKGSEWCCYNDSREIEVPRMVVDNSLKDFIDTIEKQLEKSGHRNLIYKYDDFIWCFLHEMGHLCKPKKYKDRLVRNLLDNLNMIGFNNKIINFFYYRLKEEKTATKWACDYVINNQKLVAKYNWEIVRRYKKYYKNMNLTIDN